VGRPKEHSSETGERLLDAAEELLAHGGLEAVSVRSAADLGGTTTRAVYTVFGSKDGLLAALAARGYRLLAGYVNGLPTTDDPAADLVAVGTDGFRRFARERPHLFRLTFERVPATLTSVPLVGASSRESYEALAARIERAQQHGLVQRLPVIEIAFGFHALCQGLAGGELSRQPPPVGANFWGPAAAIDAEHLWRVALEAFVRGLAPPSDAEGAKIDG
jgi:AcrR family transcriptional regulator